MRKAAMRGAVSTHYILRPLWKCGILGKVQRMKKLSFALAILLLFCLGPASIPAWAATDMAETASIESVYYGSGQYAVYYTPTKISDTVYLIQPNNVSDGREYCANNSFLNTQMLTFELQLPDNVTIESIYNGKGDPFDLSKAGAVTYEDYKATISLNNAYDNLNFGGHSYSGCYYIRLSDGNLLTLVCDSPGCQFLWNATTGGRMPIAPQSAQLYNVEQDYFYEDYAVTDLRVFGRGKGSVVNMSLSSATPIVLKAQAVYNSHDITSSTTMNNARYDASVACSSWTLINGEKTATYGTSNRYMSPAFTLKEGINVVEIVVETGGFCVSGGDNAEWFSSVYGRRTSRRTCSIVYIIDYSGSTAEIEELKGTSAEIDLSNLHVYSLSLNNEPITDVALDFDEENVRFALSANSKEPPPMENSFYERGVLLYLPVVDSGAQTEILDETKDQSFVSGNPKGFLYAINPCKIGEDNAFQVKVTSES